MTSNDIIKRVYAAVLRKIQRDTVVGFNGQKMAEIGTDIIDVGRTWTKAIGDDGRLSDAEITAMTEAFDAVVDKRFRPRSGALVSVLYNGISFLGIGFKGIRGYLNNQFGLDLG